MVKITPLLLCREIMVCSIIIFAISFTKAQSIGSPSLEITLGACANAETSFNSFNAEVTTLTGDFTSVNSFIVELSDAEGNFSNAIEVGSLPSGQLVETGTIIPFSLPVDTAGEDYEIRFRSTSPNAVSSGSVSFPAYFRVHETAFTINQLTENASFCPGAGFLLSIDEVSLFENTTSPRDFENLTYNWFRVIDDTNNELIAEAETFQIQVFEEGIYFAQTNYGSCSAVSMSNSNRVTVVAATNDDPASAVITSSLGNPFCSTGEGTTLTTIPGGDTYEWFRNDEPIDNENENTLQTDLSGNYAVIVTTGSCIAVGSLEIESLGGVTTIDVPEVNFIESGGSLLVTVESTAEDVQYEWFLNDELIEGAIENTFNATSIGNYIVRVTGIGDCDFVTELTFELRIIVDADNIPNTITPNGDGINDIWTIPADFVSGTNTEIIIVSSNGETMLETKEYTNDWPIDSETLGNGNQIFFYMITPENDAPIMGSLTVIR